MALRVLTGSEVHASMVRKLGLDPTMLDLTSIEALAAAFRRAAGFCCPCSPTTLLRAVMGPLNSLIDDPEATTETAENTLEAMVAYGDLLEFRELTAGQGKNLLYAAPPSFVLRESGAVFILGIVPEQVSALPEDLESQVEYVNHIRRMPAGVDEDIRGRLLGLGFSEILPQAWTQAPLCKSPEEYVARMDELLNAAPSSTDIPGLTLLDPARSVRYYRGRWVKRIMETGHFIGRRPQAYGADLWCYVRLQSGILRKFVDLPPPQSPVRGCDEAWHLQSAIDARRGDPQRFRVREGLRGSFILDVFSPIPMWARRRWDSIGIPVSSSGCLCSYRFLESEIQEELKFAREHLWLAELER